jgi:hypothetical protein
MTLFTAHLVMQDADPGAKEPASMPITSSTLMTPITKRTEMTCVDLEVSGRRKQHLPRAMTRNEERGEGK